MTDTEKKPRQLAANLNEAGINKPQGKKKGPEDHKTKLQKKHRNNKQVNRKPPFLRCLDENKIPTRKGLQKGTRKRRESDEKQENKQRRKNPKNKRGKAGLIMKQEGN